MGQVVPFPRRAPLVPAPEPLWRELLGEQLRRERHRRRERLRDVAERAGVSTQYLSEVERGRKDPSSELLAAVAGALDLTVRELGHRVVRGDVRSGPRGPVNLAA
jgi:transcriptional regulator with XRE-family HTH domain